MALTRANVEAVLIGRCAAALAAVSLDSTTVNGSNAALADPIRTAIRSLGYSVADPITPADSDLAEIPNTRVEQLLDLAERRVLETVLGRWTAVDQKFGQDSQSLSQYAIQLEKRVAALTAKIDAPSRVSSGGSVVRTIKAGKTPPGTLGYGDTRRWPPR